MTFNVPLAPTSRIPIGPESCWIGTTLNSAAPIYRTKSLGTNGSGAATVERGSGHAPVFYFSSE